MVMFLLAIAAMAAVLSAVINTAKTRQRFSKVAVTTHIPAAITMFVLTAHFSELTRTIGHTSVLDLIVALALFTLWTAAKSGTASEL